MSVAAISAGVGLGNDVTPAGPLKLSVPTPVSKPSATVVGTLLMSTNAGKNGPGCKLFQKSPFGSGFGTLTPRNDVLLPKSTSTVSAVAEIARPAPIAIAPAKAVTGPKHNFVFMSLSQLFGRNDHRTKERPSLNYE